MQLFSGGQNITRGSEETPRSSLTSFLRNLSATSTVCDNLNLCPYHQLYFTKATPRTVFIRVGNRPSVTRQTAEQTAEIFDLVSSRLMISGTKDISSVCSAVFKSSSSTIDV